MFSSVSSSAICLVILTVPSTKGVLNEYIHGMTKNDNDKPLDIAVEPELEPKSFSL